MPKKSTQPPPAGGASRSTRQRRAIRDAFERIGHPLSVADVVRAAREAGEPLSVTTAYRTINGLVDDGSLIAVAVPGGGTFFEAAGKVHHDHFSCMRCARVYELPGCTTAESPLPRGFRALSHETTVFGICGTCVRSAKNRPV